MAGLRNSYGTETMIDQTRRLHVSDGSQVVKRHRRDSSDEDESSEVHVHSPGMPANLSKKERNKLAAERYRVKKRIEAEQFTAQLSHLATENAELKRKVFELEMELRKYKGNART